MKDEGATRKGQLLDEVEKGKKNYCVHGEMPRGEKHWKRSTWYTTHISPKKKKKKEEKSEREITLHSSLRQSSKESFKMSHL